jgi:hypothetical protein
VKRFGDNGIGDVPINPSAIATMTVESRRALLPANASGGVIRIVLKPGAERAADTWTRKVSIRANEGAPADDATGKPRVPIDSMLVVVLDANGAELLRGRGQTALTRVDQTLIASVDVLKNSDLLPADGKQGMVKIVLKPGAALKP